MNGINFDPQGTLKTSPAYMQQGGGGFADPMTLALLGASAGFLDPHGGMMGGFQGALQGMQAGNQMKNQAAQSQMTARKLQKQIEMEDYMRGLAQKHSGNPMGIAKEMMSSGIPEVMQQAATLAKGMGTKYLQSQDAAGNAVHAIGNNFGDITNTDSRVPTKLMQVNEGNQISFRNPYTAQSQGAIGVGMAPGESARLAQSDRQFGASHGLAQQNSALARYQALQPKFVDGAFIYPPNAENPQGGMIKTDLFSAPKGSEAEKSKMADRVKNTLGDDTEQLIRQATGSTIGSAVDSGVSLFGATTKGAEANATLKLRAATLAGNMPRFEGPQSDADRKYYLEMAGDLANPSKTTTEKLVALKELKRIHNLADQNGGVISNNVSGQGGQSSYQGFSSRELP
jgi:hypothetical protein